MVVEHQIRLRFLSHLNEACPGREREGPFQVPMALQNFSGAANGLCMELGGSIGGLHLGWPREFRCVLHLWS
jgi:hypothetical protein